MKRKKQTKFPYRNDLHRLMSQPESWFKVKKKPPVNKWHIGDIYEVRIELTRCVYEVVHVDTNGNEYPKGMARLKMISPFNPKREYTQKKIPNNWKLISVK